jgi:hypothetical protein
MPLAQMVAAKNFSTTRVNGPDKFAGRADVSVRGIRLNSDL